MKMRNHPEASAKTLTHDDHVVVEATGNAAAVTEVIAHVKIKTDTIYATVLTRLYASNFLLEVWVPGARSRRCGGR